ncbi:MAG: energy-coupled thiamine transporter ThiT [Butyrivibrio sp.]|nr:energy-coupled thiamine transporter ThiT [Butyrivibrio sp.]
MSIFNPETNGLTSTGYGIAIALIIVCCLIASLFLNKEEKNKFSAKRLAFSAICIALAFVTSFVELIPMPLGGSVKPFTMFFVCFAGYLYGPRTGLTASLAYALLNAVTDPDLYVISIPQMLCDYVLAYGIMGISGFWNHKKFGMIKGYLAGVLGRFFFAFLSGLIFFAEYAPEGWNPALYSAAYNGAYIGLEAVLTVIVLLIPPVHNALNRVKTYAYEADAKEPMSLV